MKKRKAVYPASFDPITNGHLNIIERVSPLYDEVILFIAVDPRKTYLFSPEERLKMVKQSVTHFKNVTVQISTNCYAVEHAQKLGAQVLIRGLRNMQDMEGEEIMATENRSICPEIETIWIPCLPHLRHVSSSMIKTHIGADNNWKKQVARSVPKEVVKKLNEKYIFTKARKHWDSLMRDLGITDYEVSNSLFESLIRSYTGSDRFYHNLEHIVNMLDALEKLEVADIKNYNALRMAIWYHDKIYETKTKRHSKIGSNEARSAYQMELDMEKLHMSPGFIKKTSKLILATEHKNKPVESDARILVDLDLIIFGMSEEVFDEYEAGIRKEYAWMPDKDFYPGRKFILERFRKRKFIYSTKLYRQKYDHQAKDNLKRSIEMLQLAQ